MGRLVHGLFAAAVFLILPASAFAQQAGVKAGINLASLTPEQDEDPDVSRRRGFVGGVWVRMAPASRFSFQAEGLFSEKGVRFYATALGLDGEADVRFRYLEIPLLARADLGPTDSTTRVFVVGGAAPAFKAVGSRQGRDRRQGTSPGYRRRRRLGRCRAGRRSRRIVRRAPIEARYTHSLPRINTDNNDPEDRVFSVTVGFRLR